MYRHYYESINGGEPACIDELIPFDIPESWEWVRCSALGAIVRGSGIKRSDIVADGAPCVRYGELYTSYETTFTEALSHIPENLFDKSKSFSRGAVLFTLTGENKPDIGKALAYLGEQPIAAGGDLAFWEYHGLNPEFLVYSLNSPYAVGEKIKKATGDIIVHISGDKIGSILIGVPPLSEQQKIVEKIHELQPILSDYGITSSHLSKLDSGFPSSLKKSILQHAIQGKLVPQDPNDEPASVLLARIAKERAKMGKKAAKSMSRIERRDRGTYEIFPDGSEKDISGEIPFDIPESWEWCRFNSVFSLFNGDRGKNYPAKSKLQSRGEIPFISAINMEGGTISLSNLLYLSETQYNSLKAGKLQRNDWVICIRGSLGKYCSYPFDKGAIASSLVIARPNVEIIEQYMQAFMETAFFIHLNKYANGAVLPNLAAKDLGQFLFPLPPLAEQKRIVTVLKDMPI